MRRSAAVLVLLLVVAPVPVRAEDAAPMARPLLYAAVSEDATLLFVGTLHVPDTRVTAVPPLVGSAIDRADELFTEVDFSDDVRTQMLPYIRLPRNRSLPKVLGAPLVKRVEALMARHDETLEGWERIKPWVLDTHIGELFAPDETRDDTTLDQALFDRAKRAGKHVGGLESVHEQVMVFDVLDLKEQVALLEETVARLEQDVRDDTNSVEDMILAYLSGDPGRLLDEVKSYYDFEKKRDRVLYRRMHADRNERMLDRLAKEAKERPGKTRVVVVGAAHLPAEGGLLALAKARGFDVFRIRTATDLDRATGSPPAPEAPRAKPRSDPAPAGRRRCRDRRRRRRTR